MKSACKALLVLIIGWEPLDVGINYVDTFILISTAIVAIWIVI